MTITPARPPMTYDQIITKAAIEIEQLTRAGKTCHVYAWPTLSGESRDHETPPVAAPGLLIVTASEDVPPDPYQPRRAFPIYIHAPAHFQRWECIPYTDIYTVLWGQCRMVPMMSWADPVEVYRGSK